MARIRTIKPEFFTSESVSALPYSARLTFIGLWTYCDDEWRGVDNVKLIRAAIWPLDDRTLGDIEKDIDELAAHGMVVRYTVNGRNYLHIPGMGTHQRVNRPTGSKLPAPPTSGDAVRTHTRLSESSMSSHGSLTEDSPPERNGKEGKGTGNGETHRAGVRESEPNFQNGKAFEPKTSPDSGEPYVPVYQRPRKRYCDEHYHPNDKDCTGCHNDHGDAGYWSKLPEGEFKRRSAEKFARGEA
jgi:hypothetical protein